MSFDFYHYLLCSSAGSGFHECRFDSFTTQQDLLLARRRVFYPNTDESYNTLCSGLLKSPVQIL